MPRRHGDTASPSALRTTSTLTSNTDQSSRDEPREPEQKLARYAASGDEALREQIILEHLPLVRNLAMRFANRGIPLDDLLQIGTLGLIHAVDRYRPEYGTRFVTFAAPTIVGEIKRYFRDHSWFLKVPRRLCELHLALAARSEAVHRQTGCRPQVCELASELGISEEQALEAMELRSACATLSFTQLTGTEGEPGETLEERLGEVPTDYEAVELQEALRQALTGLKPRLQRLLEMRYREERTQTEVARQMGISQMQVSRLEREALTRLREILG